MSDATESLRAHAESFEARVGSKVAQITESLRTHVDEFDSRSESRAREIADTLGQRMLHVEQALDSRAQGLNDLLRERALELARTLSEGGKDVVASLDNRRQMVASAGGSENSSPGSPRVKAVARAHRCGRVFRS